MKEINEWTDEQKASFLIDTLSSNDASDDIVDAIQGWLVSDVNTEGKELKLQNVLDSFFAEGKEPTARTLELLDIIHERLGFGKKAELRKPIKRVRWQQIAARAAAVAIPVLLMAGTVLMLLTEKPASTTEQMAEVVEQSPVIEETAEPGTPGEIVLPDGSKVRLTDGSKLIYAENFIEDRKVELVGEGFFSVAKLDGKPFIVESDKLTVRVLGTEFNMKAYPDMQAAVVSLAKGKVEVGVKGKKETMQLAPMEQLVYDVKTDDYEVEEFSEILIERWSAGEKELLDVALGDALKMAADFYEMRIEMQGGIPSDKQITTTLFASSSIESVLTAVRFLADDIFDYYIDNETIFIRYE